MKTTTLQKMTFDDLPQVLASAQRAFHYPWTFEMFRDALMAGDEGWLLLKEEQLIGWGLIKNVLDELHILNFCIEPAHQRQGYGRHLLAALIARAPEAKTALLDVRASNFSAIALYEAAGFRPMGCRPGYYPAARGREDAILFSMPLTPAAAGRQYA